MSQSVSVLLLDDGELDDVQAMLEHARIPFGRVRGSSIVPGMQGPDCCIERSIDGESTCIHC
jgi:hypothetical protein